MMKRLFPTALAVLLLLLAGCTAKPDTSNQSKPTDYYLTDTDLPLDDAARLRAAPDFLTAEQQTLYRQAFALYSATKLNARLAGIGDLTGSIEADKQADLIVCSGNPLQNLSALRELDMVVKGGYRIDKPQIKKMDEVERELDKFL